MMLSRSISTQQIVLSCLIPQQGNYQDLRLLGIDFWRESDYYEEAILSNID